eukprot:6383324-Pyramimonas_sp.AAC.1
MRGYCTDHRTLDRQRRARFDDAVRGNSAVQAASHRLALDESAADLNISTTSALLDVDILYDKLGPVLVYELDMKHRYPCVVLALSIQLHLAPRCTRSLRSFSDVIIPWWSLLAGCKSALRLAARVLIDLMVEIKNMFQPGPEARTWADG